MDASFNFEYVLPPAPLAGFVESIGMFYNRSGEDKEVVVLPDGRIDLFFWRPAGEPPQVILLGLETEPEQRSVPPGTFTYVIGFKPLGVDYLLRTTVADVLNTAKNLPDDFWGFDEDDLSNFESFQKKALLKLNEHLPQAIDERKRKLFPLIYATNGEMPVAELADAVGWSSRQINRYFTQLLGLSLKAFCTILRFRASLPHIANGHLFPELNFTDQAYFIKAIKKFSGVAPKELSKNKNDRFILLSLLKSR